LAKADSGIYPAWTFPVTSGPTTGIRPDCLQVPLRMRAISPRAFDEPGPTSLYGTRRAHFESPSSAAAAAWPLAARAGDRLPMPTAQDTQPRDSNLCTRIRAADPTSFRIEMRKFESCPRLRVSVNSNSEMQRFESRPLGGESW
jgi:hypothetical protein